MYNKLEGFTEKDYDAAVVQVYKSHFGYAPTNIQGAVDRLVKSFPASDIKEALNDRARANACEREAAEWRQKLAERAI